MALVASVKDGQVQTGSSTSSANKKEGSVYNEDMFLKLLVAEVQNQDPLEPATNTEWVSQYATFSELEEMQNMSGSYELNRASSLVGKTVVMKTTSDTGETEFIEGKVDYVTYENGKALLSINGKDYSLDDLYNIADTDYLTAYNKAYEWTVSLNKLPSITNTTLDSKSTIEKLYEQYQGMSTYEKSFITEENGEKISSYVEKINELEKIAKAKEEAEAAAKAEKEAAAKAEKEEAAAAAQGTSGTENSGNTSSGEEQSGETGTASAETEKAADENAASAEITSEAASAASTEAAQESHENKVDGSSVSDETLAALLDE